RDKHQQRDLLAKAGVPVPRFMLRTLDEDPAAIARTITYPCVLKPLRLSASRGVIRANNAQRFVEAHGRLTAIVGEPGAAFLIEVAARPIGGRCSAVLKFGDGGKGTSVTLEEIILRHALGMPIPSLERERLAAGVMMIPIPGAGRLQEVRGVADAKQVPLVEDV